MDPTWILILLIPINGLVKGLSVETVAVFRSEEACLAVAEQIQEVHLKERDKKLMALCVPDILE